ncbi:MAG: repeat-containing protein, partial [Verrucomicrobiales bacterium]|nr:repeat-containing protein [Verrucomicrobiales bacterium]
MRTLQQNQPKANMNTRLTALLLGLALSLSTSLHAQSVTTVISSNLFEPNSITTDANNITYLTDGANNRVMKYNPSTGGFSLLAGYIGGSGTANGTGISARFYQPAGIVAARGGLVVADSGNHLLRFVSLSGVVSNLAGVYSAFGGYVNGAANTAQFSFPLGLSVDSAGNIYIADSGNGAIRVLDTNNIVST